MHTLASLTTSVVIFTNSQSVIIKYDKIYFPYLLSANKKKKTKYSCRKPLWHLMPRIAILVTAVHRGLKQLNHCKESSHL